MKKTVTMNFFKKDWFEQIKTEAQLMREITYRKVFNEDWFDQIKI